MAQQIFDQYIPLAKVSAREMIPVVAVIAQTRDGKDELLYGTVPFVPAGGLYVPVSAANRLPVEATLSGNSVPDGQPIPAKLVGTRADTLARRFVGMNRIARVGPLAANTTETVADIIDGASYDIEYIEFATNHDSDIRFSIRGYQENGLLAGVMRPITANGSSEIGLSVANVRQHGSAQWEIVVDDSEQNRYKLVCKRQVPVGRGFQVQVMNANMTTPYNAGVIIQYNKTAS